MQIKGSPTFLNIDAEFTSTASKSGNSTSIIKSVCLRSIECKNNSNVLTQRVNFVTGVQPIPFSNFKNEELDHIQVFDQDNIMKTSFDLGYTQSGFNSFFARNLLSSFCEHGKPNYIFNYNAIGGVLPSDPWLDYWDYYNGLTSDRVLTTPQNTPYDANIQMINPLTSGWQTNLQNAKSGLLQTITYPTGAQTAYTYEVQDYTYTYNLYPIAAPGLILTASAPGVGGGLRVSQVILSDGAGTTLTKQYKYVENYAPTATNLHSSGIMALRPNFIAYSGKAVNDQFKVDAEPLVTYSEVAEITPGNGYTIYKYTSRNLVDEGYVPPSHPYVMSAPQMANTGYIYPVRSDFVIVNFYRKRSSRGLERGKLSLATNYTSTGIPVSSIAYTYNIDPNRYSDKVTGLFFPNILNNASYIVTGRNMTNLITSYNTYFFSTKLKREDHVDYDPTGTIALNTATTWYNYNSSNQLVEKIIGASDGSLLVEKSKHVADYVLSAASGNPLKQMQVNNILAPVVEKQILRRATSSTVLLSGAVTNYLNWSIGGSVFRPANVERLEIVTPSADTTFSVINNDNLAIHQAYNVSDPAINFTGYDNLGNLQQASKPSSGVPNSYQWGYNQQYVIAEAKNASIHEFYSENFEEITGSTTGIAHTGNKFYNGSSYTVNWARPNGKIYLISYWYRSGGSWIFKAPVNYSGNSFLLSGGDAYDDVGIYPADAQITTYTYNPLAGMTSSTDAKGETTYYEYDSFLRLRNIRDRDGNILKNYCYNYAGQQTGCPIAQQVVASPYVVMTQASSVVDANGHTQNTYKFTVYADAGHTTLYAVPGNLTVNYKITTTITHSSGSPAPSTTNTNQTIVIPGGSNNATTSQIDVYHCTGGSAQAAVQQKVSVQSLQTAQAVASPNVVQPGDTVCTSSTLTQLAGTGYQIGGGVE